jgi:hypothetical protein
MQEEDKGLMWIAAFELLLHRLEQKIPIPSRRKVVNWLVVEHCDPDGVREYYTEELHAEILAKAKELVEELSGGNGESRKSTPCNDSEEMESCYGRLSAGCKDQWTIEGSKLAFLIPYLSLLCQQKQDPELGNIQDILRMTKEGK